jgi:hypothetical protein
VHVLDAAPLGTIASSLNQDAIDGMDIITMAMWNHDKQELAIKEHTILGR